MSNCDLVAAWKHSRRAGGGNKHAAAKLGAGCEAGHGPMRVLSFGSPSGRRDQMTACIGRREFITLVGGAAAAWPLAARAQQSKVVRPGYVAPQTPTDLVAANLRRQFLLGLRDLGYVEGRD